MTDFFEIGKTSDVANGTMKGVKAGGKDILIANVEGKYYAASGRCPHMKGDLSKGKLNGTIVTCPIHGSQFDLINGKVIRWTEGKGLMSLIGKLMSILGIASRKEKPLDVYEVKVEGNSIMANIPK
jgi:3-phenylpropionate/trans-cinnamate dioxygenase ferredoxin component